MREQNVRKSYDELRFRDNFMFGKVMEDPRLCRAVLECLLGHSIGELTTVQTEKEYQFISDGKPIRLDVYSEDNRGTVYDTEMQNLNHKNIVSYALSKRSRFYQASIDIDFLNKGNPYQLLPDSTVIFICTFDPFDQGASRYTFVELCEEVPGLGLKDGTTKLFFNCSYQGDGISEELRQLYDYIVNGIVSGNLTKEIDEAVLKGRRNETWRTQYMREWAAIWDAKAEGREEGKEEGANLKVIEQVCIKLKKGFDSHRIAEELEEEPSRIEEIVKIADRFKPEYDPELIYEAMEETEPVTN